MSRKEHRVKYVTTLTENVISEDRLGLSDHGYPNICINGKNVKYHILSFKAFYPEEYASKKTDEMVLHEDDNKIDSRPHKLRRGTHSENTKDVRDNGQTRGHQDCVSVEFRICI